MPKVNDDVTPCFGIAWTASMYAFGSASLLA